MDVPNPHFAQVHNIHADLVYTVFVRSYPFSRKGGITLQQGVIHFIHMQLVLSSKKTLLVYTSKSGISFSECMDLIEVSDKV